MRYQYGLSAAICSIGLLAAASVPADPSSRTPSSRPESPAPPARKVQPRVRSQHQALVFVHPAAGYRMPIAGADASLYPTVIAPGSGGPIRIVRPGPLPAIVPPDGTYAPLVQPPPDYPMLRRP